jgi:hypothetical protein
MALVGILMVLAAGPGAASGSDHHPTTALEDVAIHSHAVIQSTDTDNHSPDPTCIHPACLPGATCFSGNVPTVVRLTPLRDAIRLVPPCGESPLIDAMWDVPLKPPKTLA